MAATLPASDAPAGRHPAESKTTVVVALLANLVVAAAKLAAAWRTGSSVMLSEAIHCEPAEGKLLTQIRELACAEPTIQRVRPVLSSYLGPREILVVLPVEFAPDLPAAGAKVS